MEGYDASTYGERWADIYDERYDDPDEVTETVTALCELSAPTDGPLLELGIGTGRLALPLAAAGYDVRGIDASPAMLERLRAKPGGPAIPVTLGDMAEVEVPRRRSEPAAPPCRGVFVATNTFFGLATETAQRRCLQRVAEVLAPGGWFVCAAFVPDLVTPPPAQGTVGVQTLTADRVVLTADRHDAAAQTISGQFIDISAGGIALRPFHLRYLLPAQLDDLAAAAGLQLERRSADWRGAPFDEHSATQVSRYRRT